MIDLTTALNNLRPGEQYRLEGHDIASIEWINKNVIPITEKELNEELDRLNQMENDEMAKNELAKKAAVNHAKSLGFNDEMIAVMYPNLKV